MMRQGRVPAEINANKIRDVINSYVAYIRKQLNKALNQKLYKETNELSVILELVETFEDNPAKLTQVIADIVNELNARRLAYERIQTYQSEIRKLDIEISRYCLLKTESKNAYEQYLHALKFGQSEQQNRMVISMDAREQIKKCNFLIFTCCVKGQLTDPHLVESVNSSFNPDKNAKKLGLRSMVGNVTMAYTYRRLRKRKAIHVYRMGMIEENIRNGGINKDELNGIVTGDSMSLSEECEDITNAEYNKYHGRVIDGINRRAFKSKLVYKFSQENSAKYSVSVVYDSNIIVEHFYLYMNTMADLTRRGVILYTPEGSNTTFVAPKLLKVLGEVQMKKILIG